MYCRFCGKENKPGAKFCTGCGKRIIVNTQSILRKSEKWSQQDESSPKIFKERGKNKKSKALLFLLVMFIIVLIVGCIIATFFIRGGSLNSRSNILPDSTSTNNDDQSLAGNESIAEKSSKQNDGTDSSLTSSSEDVQSTIDVVNPAEDKSEKQIETEYYSSAYADNHSYYGNSFENISQGGLMVSMGDWLYYTEANSDNTVWRMKHDGTGKEKVLDVSAWHMSIINGWLYYREYSSRGYLCRYNLQDNKKEILVKRKVYEPKVVGRYIYYGDESDKSYDLYRIDIDGNNEIKLTDGIVLYCCVTDQRIFYLDTAVDRKGYSIDLDGNDKQLWYAGRVGTIDYYDGLIYFTDADEGGLFTLDPKDNTVEKISNLTMWSINVYNGWIYYADGKNNGALTRTSLSDTNKKEKLSGDSCELINVSGGWIQYHINGEEYDRDYYWIPVEVGESKQF